MKEKNLTTCTIIILLFTVIGFLMYGFFNDIPEGVSDLNKIDPIIQQQINNMTEKSPFSMPSGILFDNLAALPDTVCYKGTIPAYPTGVYGHVSNWLGDTLYLCGGSAVGEGSVNVYRYSLLSDSWSTGVSMPESKTGGSLVKCGNALYYIGGGTAISGSAQTASTLRYRVGMGWDLVAPILTPVVGNAAICYGDSVIYCLLGGWTQYYRQVQVYRPSSNTWSRGSDSLPAGAGRRTLAGGIVGNKIYVACGFSGAYRKDMYVGTIGATANSITWVLGPAVPCRGTGMSRPGGVGIDGHFYVIGAETTPLLNMQDSIFMFNTTFGTWLTPLSGRGTGAASNYWGSVSARDIGGRVNIFIPGGGITGATTWGLYVARSDGCDLPLSPLVGDYTVGTALFNRATGKNITFEKTVKKVLMEVYERVESNDRRNSSIKNDENFSLISNDHRKVMKEIEEVTYAPMENGKVYDGPLYAKRSEFPNLPGDAGAGVYATITAAVNDLNFRGVSAPVRFLLLDATYPTETYPITINSIIGGSAVNTFTIKPNTGVTTVVSGSAASGLFKLNGADFIRLDGSNTDGSDRSMTIANSNTSGVDIWIASASASDGASNNTVKNCILSGVSLAGIISGSGIIIGGDAETANSDNSIQNCAFTKTQNAMYLRGGASSFDQNWFVTGNSCGSATVTDYLTFRGIAILNAQNFNISNNIVTGVVSSTTSTASGIFVFSGANGGTISKNKISNVHNINTGGWGSNGINLSATTTSSNITVSNNFIWDIASYGYLPAANVQDNGYGIMASSGGGYKIYHNSVSMNTNQTVDGLPAALNVSASITTAGSLEIRDNIFSNTQTVGVNRYSVYCGAANTVFANINYNDYYFATAPNLGFLGSNRATLANWKTATAKDTNSVSVDPLFKSNTDLHIDTTTLSMIDNSGISIDSITTDIDGNFRNEINADIGADEFVGFTLDVFGPEIYYTSLSNNLSTSNRSFTLVSITDASGVNGTISTRPRCYFKRKRDLNTFINNTNGSGGWKYVQATGSISPFDFTINYALLSGGGVTLGDTVQYFIDAADMAAIPNIGINSGIFEATPASVALTAAAFPIGGTINSYIITNIQSSHNACNNGDFENDNDHFTNWTGAKGKNYSGIENIFSGGGNFNAAGLPYGVYSEVCPPNSCPCPETNAINIVDNTGTGMDPIISTIPKTHLSNHAVRIGNSADCNGLDLLAKTFVVNATTSNFSFWYALILESPGHDPNDQPFFMVRVKNSDGYIVPNIGLIIVSDASNPFFQFFSNGYFACKDWDCANIDLSSLLGQKVTVEFIAGDCRGENHWGYAYIDDICLSCDASPSGNCSINALPSSCDKLPLQVCGNFILPQPPSGVAWLESVDLKIYQNGNQVGTTITIPGSAITGNSFCFTLNATDFPSVPPDGFDFVASATFAIFRGFSIDYITKSSSTPGNGITPGMNNDYHVQCGGGERIEFPGTASGDKFGFAESGIGDFNGDGFDDFIVGAPGVNAGAANAGAAYVYFGENVFITRNITILGVNVNEGFGSSVGGNFDINGDGFKDIIVGAPGWNDNTGRVYVFFGKCDFPAIGRTSNNADIIINGENAAPTFGLGFKVSSAGDVNGDCIDDIIMSNPYWNNKLGRVYTFYGIKNWNLPNPRLAASANVIMSGIIPNGLFGYSIAALGDIKNFDNGDKIDDIIIGAPVEFAPAGHAYIFYGGCPVMNNIPDREYCGDANGDFGISVAGLGDINGNGYKDFIVGDWIFPTVATGSAIVYDGNTPSACPNYAANTLYNITGQVSANNEGRFGTSVAGIGDYDGLKFNDFLVGARGMNDYAGRVYRFEPDQSHVPLMQPYVNNNSNPPNSDYFIMAGVPNDNMGYSTSWAGDINGDGRNDALWGAYGLVNNTGGVILDKSTSDPTSYTKLNLKAFVEGYYGTLTSVKVCLYNQLCELVDEKNVLLAPNGVAHDADQSEGIKFNNLPPNTPFYSNYEYYIVIKGMCNSIITTWSSTRIRMTKGEEYSYDFTTPVGKAYNNNQRHMGNNIYAIYSGDVNGDCVIDLADMLQIDNDAINFVSGGCCLKTDLNGDGIVDLSDVAIGDNNAYQFIICESPCQCPCQ